jgi:hypothetical protein
MEEMLNEPSRFEPLWSITTTAEYLGVAIKTLYVAMPQGRPAELPSRRTRAIPA